MLNKNIKNVNHENTLYNNIVSLARNKIFYTKFELKDTFQNRIHLIFIHVSFLFIKIKQKNDADIYKAFYQQTFDLIFNNVELNMRELGYGDTTINKNMKSLVKIFYDILLNCENYKNKSDETKTVFLSKFLQLNDHLKMPINQPLINYFDKYQAFCFDLTSNSVLRGDLNFIYKEI